MPSTDTRPIILLASASPRRRDLLEQLGYAVRPCAAPIDETPYAGETARDYVQRMAVEKNRAAVQRQPPANDSAAPPLLSADTTVALNGRILGKPADAADAAAMLNALSGQTHQVLTAVCLSRNGIEYTAVQQSDVHFRPLSAAEIAAYIASGEPMDKAGAYGIQGRAAVGSATCPAASAASWGCRSTKPRNCCNSAAGWCHRLLLHNRINSGCSGCF